MNADTKVKLKVTCLFVIMLGFVGIAAHNSYLQIKENGSLLAENSKLNGLLDKAEEALNVSGSGNLERRYAQLRDYVVIPALEHLNMDTKANINLMMITIHAETKGELKRSTVHGNDYGVTQINIVTYNDMVRRYLKLSENSLTKDKLYSLASPSSMSDDLVPHHFELMSNDKFAVGFAAAVYQMKGYEIDNRKDIMELCAIWVKHYNTKKGLGTVGKCMDSFPESVLL